MTPGELMETLTSEAQARGDLYGDVSFRFADSVYPPSPDDGMVVLATHRLGPGVKYAAWVQVSMGMLADAEAVSGAIYLAFDRRLRPWAYPDRPTWPTFNLFPRMNALLARWRQWQNRRALDEWDRDD